MFYVQVKLMNVNEAYVTSRVFTGACVHVPEVSILEVDVEIELLVT